MPEGMGVGGCVFKSIDVARAALTRRWRLPQKRVTLRKLATASGCPRVKHSSRVYDAGASSTFAGLRIVRQEARFMFQAAFQVMPVM